MKRVITAAILIPLVLLLLLKGTLPVIVVAAAIVAGLATWEYLAIADAHGAQTPRILTLVCVAILFAVTYRDPALLLAALGACSLLLLTVCGFRSPLDRVLPDTAYSIFALLYCGLTLVTLPLLWSQPNGPSLLIFLLCIVWAGDIAALYVGRTFGRTKLAPTMSPKKSWEGSAASIAGSILTAAGLLALSHHTNALHFPGWLPRWLGLAAVLNIFAQVGDLLESAIKRGAGVKDSGAMLPGHGGILDRIDALLLAAPALWYAQWILERASWR